MKTLACSSSFCNAATPLSRSRLQCFAANISIAVLALFVMPSGVQASSMVPKVERISKAAPNAPYVVRGVKYKPLNDDVPFKQRGMASWYGGKFHGRMTASGEIYDKYAFTAAHRTLPLPSYVLVRHIRTGREVIVRVNDRGPFHGHRIIDLSRAAATALGVQSSGTAEVEIERLTFDDIRTGRWQSPEVLPSSESNDASTNEANAAAADPLHVPALDSGNEVVAAANSQAHWLQLGTFTNEAEAEEVKQSIASKWQSNGEHHLTLVRQGESIRLFIGPFMGEIQAAQAVREVRHRLQLTPLIFQ